jgi:hypothetical protein
LIYLDVHATHIWHATSKVYIFAAEIDLIVQKFLNIDPINPIY